MVEPPRTHSKLPCSPVSPFITGGSVQLNHPELTRTFRVVLLPPSSQSFEEVWCGRTTPNSLEPALYSCFSLNHSRSRRFGVVEPPQTHLNLLCSPASPFITVDRGGSVWLNHPESPVVMLPPSSQWFEEVRCGRTTPNSLEPAL